MSLPELVKIDHNTYAIKGVVTYDTVPALLSQGMTLFSKTGENQITIDLAEIHEPSTVCVALLVVWQSKLLAINKTIEYRGAPQKLLSVIGVSNVNKILGL